MPDDALLDISIKTGLEVDKLEKELAVIEAITPLFTALENGGQKTGLYGGTALNKIYFDAKQRLSYDLDIFCYSFNKTVTILKKIGAETRTLGNDRAGLYYKHVKLDLWSVKKTSEDPKKHEVKSILSFFGYRIPTVMCPSYSLEFLLAKKTIAMASRNLLKDIYDVWTGFQLLKNRRLFFKYLDMAETEENLDSARIFREIVGKNTDYYKDKQVDTLNHPPADVMIWDIDKWLNQRGE